MIELKEKVSEEQRAVEPDESINTKPTVVVLPPPHRSSRIFCPLERYLSILTEDVEKIFLVGDKDHKNGPKIYDEMMSNIDSEKWLNVMKSEIDSIHSN